MPFVNQLHLDTLLSQISVKYRNTDFIAMDVFPELQVNKDSDLFRVYDRDWRLPETHRANKGVANTRYWEVSSASYILEDHALKDYISQDDIDNYDIADLRADTTEDLTDVILRRVEKSVADLFTSTNWSLNVSLSATQTWSLDTTASNPIPIVDTAGTTVINNAGLPVNYMILPRTGFVAVKNHQSVVDRVKYTQGPTSQDVTKGMLAGLFGVQNLYVPTASYDTAAKGVASSISNIWPNHAFLGYKPDRPGPKQPSAGYIFRKNVPMVRRWFDDERNCEAIEVRMKYQARVVASLSGYLIKAIY